MEKPGRPHQERFQKPAGVESRRGRRVPQRSILQLGRRNGSMPFFCSTDDGSIGTSIYPQHGMASLLTRAHAEREREAHSQSNLTQRKGAAITTSVERGSVHEACTQLAGDDHGTGEVAALHGNLCRRVQLVVTIERAWMGLHLRHAGGRRQEFGSVLGFCGRSSSPGLSLREKEKGGGMQHICTRWCP